MVASLAADLGCHAERGGARSTRRRARVASDVQCHPGHHGRRAPAAVWPWLLQVGVGRAGWYSYDLLDNLGRPSARLIVPELQHLAVGDIIPMNPGGTRGMRVHALRPPHSMIWGTPGDTTWIWQLDPDGVGSTRLITRVRSRYRPFSPAIAFSLLIEFADVWMMRKMLRSLRDRAEQGAQTE